MYGENVRFYSANELIQDALWKDLVPPRTIGKIETTERIARVESSSEDDLPFNPRFRIVLSLERIGGGGVFGVY